MRELDPSHYYFIGRFQKRAAKFAQEFTASANNVRLCNYTKCHLLKLNPFSIVHINLFTLIESGCSRGNNFGQDGAGVRNRKARV
jgi:hypothetical protein